MRRLPSFSLMPLTSRRVTRTVFVRVDATGFSAAPSSAAASSSSSDFTTTTGMIGDSSLSSITTSGTLCQPTSTLRIEPKGSPSSNVPLPFRSKNASIVLRPSRTRPFPIPPVPVPLASSFVSLM